MSWSDDMRCLYCDGKLPLYRKITNGQFCSTSHRKAYWLEQERLAVERLHQTHSSLAAARPPVPAESILGPAAAPAEAVLGGFLPCPRLYPQSQGAPLMLAVDPLVYEMELQPGKPLWVPREHEVRSLPGASAIRMAQVWFEAQWLKAGKGAGRVAPRGGDCAPRWVALQPVSRLEPGKPAQLPVHVPPMSALRTQGILPQAAAPVISLNPRNEIVARMERPEARLRLGIAPVNAAANAETENRPQAAPEPVVPAVDRMFALGRFCPNDAALVCRSAIEPVPSLLPLISHPEHRVEKTAQLAEAAGPQPMARLAAVAGARAAAAGASGAIPVQPIPVQPIPMQVDTTSQGRSQRIQIPSSQLGLGMGRGCRYPVQYKQDGKPGLHADPVALHAAHGEVKLPGPQAATPQPNALLDAIVPPPAGLVALKVKLGGPVTKPIRALLLDIATIPQPLKTEHILRGSGLEPMDDKPVSDHFEMDEGAVPASMFNRMATKAHLWTQASRLWRVAPRDLKMLAFAIPALLALAFHRELPKVRVAAPQVSTAVFRNSLHNAVNTQLTSVQKAVMDRAGVALDDDFRSGLDDWGSKGDATAIWSFDATGFVQPGPLALYRPSMNLGDYELQFLGMIDKKALSWVVRAADWDNYYVVKLEVLKPGPRTTLGLTRYAVINGIPERRVDTPVPIEAQPDTLYRVGVEVEGENFSVTIQGQMIDSWSEPRLMHGGVGFFTSAGEGSRVRWIAVRHQYDMLGRLCAYLAPYEIPTTDGSW